MDLYAAHREAPPAAARSPQERTNWAAREEPPRFSDRTDRTDTFYRGRSPGNDRRRPRNRSRSPLAVDRYEPNARVSREDYGGPRDAYGKRERDDRRRVASPGPAPANIDRYVPGQDSGPPPVSTNPVHDPSKLSFQVGFSYFGEWWRANEKIKEEKERLKSGRRREPERLRGQRESQEERDKEKARIQVAYDTYKEELQAKMARMFVQEHKGEQWFREKYFAEIRDPLRQKFNEFRRGNYSQWEQDLEFGVFDDFSLEGIPKSESNGAGGVIEKEEGETTATNEVLGVGDLLPVKGSDIRDEMAFQPTLLIKTIAPHVSREKLEAFCKEHLGEDEGGFKWLSLSDPNPSKRYHRIGWVMLHPAADVPVSTDRGDGRDDEENREEAEIAKPVSTAEKALEAINGKQVKDEERGDFTCHVGVHAPPVQPRKKALWDLFSAPERVEKDLELASRLINKYEEDFGSDFNAVLKIEERVEELKNQGRLQPAIPASTEKTKKRDLDLDEAMESGEEDNGEVDEEEEEEEEGALDEEVDDEDLLVKKRQLDMMVEYLRRVFNFCFFCVFESDSVHELTRKCPGGHLRRPRNTLSTAGKAAARASALGEPFPGAKARTDSDEMEISSPEGERKFRNNGSSKADQQLQRAFNWVKTFEDKIMQILEPENVDVTKLGGQPIEEALQQELAKYVKQEDEHKFRCKVPECAKLFKEHHFWKKHVEKRHPEWYEALKRDLELVNTYVLDPAHIAPSRSDANSNGHFPPTNGHMQTGTPRGFNLNHFQLGMGPVPPPGFAMFLPPGMQGPPWPGMSGDDRGFVGPIRRGGGARFPNSRPGPYDRRPRDPRFGGESGRLSPPGVRAGQLRITGGNAGGRWGDGAAGGAAVGPREAVQGRSLKSYEDLDAVAGIGGGELNY